MQTKTDVLIVGGGISGCAAAQQLQHRKRDYCLIEQNAAPGGLTRSIHLGNASFDYTGHFLHLAHWNTPEEIPFAKQQNIHWQRISRRAGVVIKDAMVPAPFQYNLAALPQPLAKKCYNDFQNRTPSESITSFSDYLFSGFGKSICELFLFPYNEKLLDIPLNQISTDNVKRFFPKPDATKIANGYENITTPATEYNSRFWYPKRNGIGLLAKGLADGLDHIKTSTPLLEWDMKKQTVTTPSGQITYNQLISSLPLKYFAEKEVSGRLGKWANQLSHNSVLSLNLQYKTAVPQEFSNWHWLYFPSKSVPFYRLGIYSNLPQPATLPGYSSVYVETAFHSEKTKPALNTIIHQIIKYLDKKQWWPEQQLHEIAANWIPCAYVHFTPQRSKAVQLLNNAMQQHHVSLIGRYGLWDYISMEDSIISGIETAKSI